jgi:hypothetical protein
VAAAQVRGCQAVQWPADAEVHSLTGWRITAAKRGGRAWWCAARSARWPCEYRYRATGLASPIDRRNRTGHGCAARRSRSGGPEAAPPPHDQALQFQFGAGLQAVRSYRRKWLAKDIVAGIVLTTLLVPQGLAYAELAGLPPITGLYTSIMCLLGYAVFGPSRILVLGPDSSLGPMIAATILPLIVANGDEKRAIALASVLAVMVPAIMIVAAVAKLGFIADLISKPTMIGYVNGLALTILVGQPPKLFGFKVEADGFIGEVIGFCGHPPPLRLTLTDELQTLAPAAFATPLGIHPHLHSSTYSVRAGDRLLFFTDGLLEARDRAGRFFRLDEHIQTLRQPSLQSAADELLGRLRAHTRHRLDDNVALLLVELTLTKSADKTPDEHPWPATSCRLAAR